jgi:hypothetical protein
MKKTSDGVIYTSKAIAGGTKKQTVKKDGSLSKKVVYPSNDDLRVESLENHLPNAPRFVIKAVDDQLKQHDASNAWRNTGGDMSKLPTKATAGKKLWWDGECIRVNWSCEVSERGGSSRIKTLTASVQLFADSLSKADPTRPISMAQAVVMMGLNKADQRSVLDYLNGQVEEEEDYESDEEEEETAE